MLHRISYAAGFFGKVRAVKAHSTLLGLFLLAACSDDTGAAETDSTSTGDGTDTVATTIPTPSTSSTATVGDSSSSEGDSSGSTTTGEEGSSSGDGSSGSGSSSGDTGSTTYEIGWCILAYPPEVTVATDEAFTVYTRVFAEGLTDLTGENDPDDALVVEQGYGLDGTDPAVDDWTWTAATPNVGYGPDAPDYSEVNDEYLGDLSIDTAGLYDYAARVSGDGGTTWVYCDLDGLTEGGYTPEQAGNAAVGQ